MKLKVFLVSVFAMIGLSLSAADLTTEQLSFRSSIVDFLRNEGYMPSIDDDGDIKFKCEGNTMYVQIASNFTEVFNVTLKLIQGITDPENNSQALRAYRAANDVNDTKYWVKCCIEKTDAGSYYLVVTIETLVTKSLEYTKVLQRYINGLNSAVGLFKEKY